METETVVVEFHCSICNSPLRVEVNVNDPQLLWDCYCCGQYHDISERLDDAKLAVEQEKGK